MTKRKFGEPIKAKKNESLKHFFFSITSTKALVFIVGILLIALLYTNIRIENAIKKVDDTPTQQQGVTIVITPTGFPTPFPTPIPTSTPSVKQNTNDDVRKRKEKEIAAINEQINQILELQKGDIELLRTATETLKKCTSEWCIDTLKKEAEYWQGQIKEKDEQIEALEQQRATIISGL